MPVVSGFNTSDAVVTAIAAPGDGYKIGYKRIKINVVDADTVIIKSGIDVEEVEEVLADPEAIPPVEYVAPVEGFVATELDRFILPAKGLAVEEYGANDYIFCNENEPLAIYKTGATDMFYRITYGVFPV